MLQCARLHIHKDKHTHIYTYTYVYVSIDGNAITNTPKDTRTHTHRHTKRTHTHTHTKTPYTRTHTHTKHAQTYTNKYIHWSIADILYRGTSFKTRSASWPAGEIHIEAAGWSLTASSSGGKSPRTKLCHPKISEAPTLHVWKSSSGRNLPLTRPSTGRIRRGSSDRRSPRRALQGWASLERG